MQRTCNKEHKIAELTINRPQISVPTQLAKAAVAHESLKDKFPKTESNRSALETVSRIDQISKQAENAGESMEKLSIAELAIYSGLVLRDLASFKMPSPVIFANAAESLVEWLSNKMISSDEHNHDQLGPFFESLANVAAKIFGIKDQDGNLVQGSRNLVQHKDKVIGALITAMNSLGMVNSLTTLGSGVVKRKNTANHPARQKNQGAIGQLASLAGVFFPGVNTLSMLVCSAIKEHYAKAINSNPGKLAAHHQKLSSSLYTSANEDMRCAGKSALAMIVDGLKVLGIPGANLIDGLGGTALNTFGILNGVNGMRGIAEGEEANPTPLHLSSNPLLRKLGEAYLKMTGVDASLDALAV